MEIKSFWQKFTENKKLFWGVIGGTAALLVIVGIVLALLLGGNSGLSGCTVTVKTEGGMALKDIDVYIYEAADKKELVAFVKTNEEGVATFTGTIPAGSVAVLEGVPAGYAVAENYPITEAATTITLTAELLKEMAPITLGGMMFDFTVTDTDGTSHTLSELLKEKNAVVLNLWYTHCDPCKAEFPFLQQAYDAYSSDIALLALNPVAEDDEAAVKAFKETNGLTFPMAKVDTKWAEQIKNVAYPTTVIIDRYGMISLIHTGSIDKAKTFKDAFAFFAAEDYVQTVVANISTLVTKDETADQGGNEETTAPPETTAPSETTAPTVPEETTKPNKPSGGNSGSGNSGSGNSGSSTPGGNYDGTLVNADDPIVQFGLNAFDVEVGGGEKVLVNMVRVVVDGTLVINDKDAYVVYNGKMYKPNSSGKISISIAAQDSNSVLPIEIGNAGTAAKTFQVKFSFPKGSRENPIKMEQGQTTVSVKSGNEQGVFYTFQTSKAGTLTLTVKGINPSTVLCGIFISDMQEVPTTVALAEGETSVSIDLPANAKAEIIISSRDPKDEWKFPKAEIVIEASFV